MVGYPFGVLPGSDLHGLDMNVQVEFEVSSLLLGFIFPCNLMEVTICYWTAVMYVSHLREQPVILGFEDSFYQIVSFYFYFFNFKIELHSFCDKTTDWCSPP